MYRPTSPTPLHGLKALVARGRSLYTLVPRHIDANRRVMEDPQFEAYLPKLLDTIRKNEGAERAIDAAEFMFPRVDQESLKNILITKIVDFLPGQLAESLDIHALGTVIWLDENIGEGYAEFPRVLQAATDILATVRRNSGLDSARHLAQNQILRCCSGLQLRALAQKFLDDNPEAGPASPLPAA